MFNDFYFNGQHVPYHKIKTGTIMAESNWDQYATRYEPKFQKRYIDSNDKYFMYSDNYKKDLATSWGLYQIMGVNLRKLGFDGDFRNDYLPDTKLQEFYYDKYTRRFLKKYQNNVGDFIASYNAGKPRFRANGEYKNQTYVNRVLRFAGVDLKKKNDVDKTKDQPKITFKKEAKADNKTMILIAVAVAVIGLLFFKYK